jgi:glutaminase
MRRGNFAGNESGTRFSVSTAGRGKELSLIDEVYKSEAATNTGNKALSMLLAKYERIYADPFEPSKSIGELHASG